MYGLIYWIGYESKSVLHQNYYKISNGEVTATDDKNTYYSARLMAESENAGYLDKLVVSKDGLKLYSEQEEYFIRGFTSNEFVPAEESERILARLVDDISSESDVNSKIPNSRGRSTMNIQVASNGTPSQKTFEAYISYSEDVPAETSEIVPSRDAVVASESSQSLVGSSDMPDHISMSQYLIWNSDDTPVETSERMPSRDADVASESSESSVGSSDMPDHISLSKSLIRHSDDTPVETSERMPSRDADVSSDSGSESSRISYVESVELNFHPKLTCAAEALEFKTELIAGTGVYVDTKKLEQFLLKYISKSNRLATALMRAIVGDQNLIKMSCTGRAPYEQIPLNTYETIQRYVERKAEPPMSGSVFQRKITFLCQKIRNAKEAKAKHLKKRSDVKKL